MKNRSIKCYFFGHLWEIKYQTERKNLCKCTRCGATDHYDKERKVWSKRYKKLVKQ